MPSSKMSSMRSYSFFSDVLSVVLKAHGFHLARLASLERMCISMYIRPLPDLHLSLILSSVCIFICRRRSFSKIPAWSTEWVSHSFALPRIVFLNIVIAAFWKVPLFFSFSFAFPFPVSVPYSSISPFFHRRINSNTSGLLHNRHAVS